VMTATTATVIVTDTMTSEMTATPQEPAITAVPTETPAPTATPEPQMLPVTFTLANPVMGTVYYDMPTVALQAPPGQAFTWENDSLLLVDEAGNAQGPLNLLLTGETGQQEPQNLPAALLGTTLPLSPTSAITLSWQTMTNTAPLSPGLYHVAFGALVDGSARRTETQLFTVTQPLTATIKPERSYRSRPIWSPTYEVRPREQDGQPLVVEVLGFWSTGPLQGRDTSKMLLIRLPGTHRYYWLGDQDTVESGESWNAFFEALETVPELQEPIPYPVGQGD
jgi:hypothetical protein